MDERVKFIAGLLDGEKMAALCRQFGVSRKTGYKILNRYNSCGLEGLRLRPTKCANRPLAKLLADYVQILPISVITADNTPAHAAARSFASFLIDSRHSLHRRRSQLTPQQNVTQSPPK